MKLKELESDGWEIDQSDKDRIAKQKHQAKTLDIAANIADSIIELTQVAKELQKSNYDSNMKIGFMLMDKLDDLKKMSNTQKWTFNIKRGPMGFISKITATRE